MSPELDKKLVETYPEIFRDRYSDIRSTAMCWGFECGDGWYDLVDSLCRKLTFLSKVSGLQIVADQVKEKFGTLRFYFHTEGETKEEGWFDIVNDVVDVSEHRSRYTCEVCGEYGECEATRGWYSTLCEVHRKERESE